MKRLRITIDGKAYDVAVEILDQGGAPAPFVSSGSPVAASTPIIAAPVRAAAPTPVAAGAGDVPSPLAGKVVSLDVAIGATVSAGEQILTLEAMKMNTVVSSPVAGTITAFKVTPGETVQEGQVLAVIG